MNICEFAKILKYLLIKTHRLIEQFHWNISRLSLPEANKLLDSVAQNVVRRVAVAGTPNIGGVHQDSCFQALVKNIWTLKQSAWATILNNTFE